MGKMAIEKKVEKPAEKLGKLVITASDEERVVIDWNQKGGSLEFDSTSFKVLPEGVLRQLSFENARAYFLSEAANRQHEKAKDRPKDAPKIEVLSPLQNRAMDRLKIRCTDKEFEKKNHMMWAGTWEVEDRKDVGYALVEESDPVKTKGVLSPTGKRIIKRGDGSEELVLMKVPAEKYDMHIRAMSETSRNMAKSAPRAQLESGLDDMNRREGTRVKSAEIEQVTTKATLSANDLKDV
jgi:hypothetical protein